MTAAQQKVYGGIVRVGDPTGPVSRDHIIVYVEARAPSPKKARRLILQRTRNAYAERRYGQYHLLELSEIDEGGAPKNLNVMNYAPTDMILLDDITPDDNDAPFDNKPKTKPRVRAKRQDVPALPPPTGSTSSAAAPAKAAAPETSGTWYQMLSDSVIATFAQSRKTYDRDNRPSPYINKGVTT